jgi:hypothetical protein
MGWRPVHAAKTPAALSLVLFLVLPLAFSFSLLCADDDDGV